MSDPNYLATFRQNVLERMINQALLDQHSQSLGIRISGEQIKKAIREMPAFINNGIFNNEQYLATLRRNGLSPEQFAEYIRQDLARQFLIDALKNSEFVLKGELEARYALENQTRTVKTSTIPLADFISKVEITEEQKKAHYDSSPAQYMKPEQYKISYVELSGKGLADTITVSDEEAETYYQQNKQNYGTAEKRKVSHIMLEIEGDSAEKKAHELLTQLKNGADFATLAKEHSDDTFSAEEGGQLDWFDKGVMDPAFEEAAYKLAATGDLTDVVKSEFGYHIIKLDEINAADIKPFTTVKDEITTQLKQQKAVEQFYQHSTQLAEKAFEMPDNLDEAAAASQGTVITTELTALADLTGALANPAVIQALQTPEVKDDALNSELIEISPEHVIVVRVDEVQPESVQPFASVSDQIESHLKRQEAEKNAEAFAESMVSALKQQDPASLGEAGFSFGEAKVLTRQSPEREIAKLAFTMPKPSDEQSQYDTTKLANGDLVIVSLDQVQSPALENADLTPISERSRVALENTDIASILAQLKEIIDVQYTSDISKTAQQ